MHLKKQQPFLVFTDWLCKREDLLQTPWLENLWASKPFMRICPLWICVCNFSMRWVCWFLSQDLVVLLAHVFLSYYMFLAATKHWTLLFFVHPRDTKCVSLMSALRQVEQKSPQRLEHLTYVPLFSFVSLVRVKPDIFSQSLWAMPVLVCNSIRSLTLSKAAEHSFVFCGPWTSKMCWFHLYSESNKTKTSLLDIPPKARILDIHFTFSFSRTKTWFGLFFPNMNCTSSGERLM